MIFPWHKDLDLFVSGDRIQKCFDPKIITKKNVSFTSALSCGAISVNTCQGGRTPRVKRCLHGNWVRGEKKTVKKTIQNLVPSKNGLRFGDVKPSLNQREDIFLLHKDTVL